MKNSISSSPALRQASELAYAQLAFFREAIKNIDQTSKKDNLQVKSAKARVEPIKDNDK